LKQSFRCQLTREISANLDVVPSPTGYVALCSDEQKNQHVADLLRSGLRVCSPFVVGDFHLNPAVEFKVAPLPVPGAVVISIRTTNGLEEYGRAVIRTNGQTHWISVNRLFLPPEPLLGAVQIRTSLELAEGTIDLVEVADLDFTVECVPVSEKP
jgi:hypothetical protein